MPLQNGKNSVIHNAGSADLSGYTYTQVYTSAATSPIINGTEVSMAAGSTIDIVVRSISGTLTNVFVIGDKKTTSDPGGTTGVIL